MKRLKINEEGIAVWIAAVRMTYERYKVLLSDHKKIHSDDFWFTQNDILKEINDLYCTDSIALQIYNGDYRKSEFNYLRGIGKLKRLSKVHEFGEKICPHNIDFEKYIDTKHGIIKVADLIDWYTFDYTLID